MLDHISSTLSEDIFKFMLELEGKRAMRYEYFFSILVIELDQSENGELSPILAELIQQSTRNTDLIGRIEDQQFIVGLHQSESSNTYSVGERIRDRVAIHNFGFNEDRCRRTVSVGGACFPTHGTDIQSLILTASEMLMRARSMGGNRVSLPDM